MVTYNGPTGIENVKMVVSNGPTGVEKLNGHKQWTKWV